MRAPTSDERREIAARLRRSHAEWLGVSAYNAITYVIGATGRPVEDDIADLIDRTCTYEPEETRGYRDEEGFEHETSEPSDGCASFACSECGFVMPRGIGWFDDEPPYKPHFSFCPGCGSRLVPRTLYDRVADAKEDGDGR